MEDSAKAGNVVVEDITDVSLVVSDLSIKFDNLFGGKAPALAETADWLPNKNTEAFIRELTRSDLINFN